MAEAAVALRGVSATTMIVVSTLSFSLMHACVRHLGVVEAVHPFIIAFIRSALGGAVLFAWVLQRGKALPRGRAMGMIAGRAALNTAAMLCFFAALGMTELTTVTALNFTAPLFVTLGAWLLFGERLRTRRIGALVVGFAGVAVVMRPSIAVFEPGPYLALASSVLWAGAMLLIKRLTATVDSVTITAYSGLMMAVLSLAPALFFWQWPTPTQWAWLALTTALGTVAQLSLAEAFRRAEAGAVMPFDFLKLIWASLLGLVWFGDTPSPWAWAGGAVIFAASVYIAHRERRSGRPVAAPPA
ncbi:MAG: DMT family transporter [Alphaproteobacteria bacterium]